MKTKSKVEFRAMPERYSELCQLLLPRPIRSQADYDEVAEVAEAMAGFGDEFTSDQQDYFELLCSLMEEYDSKRVKWSRTKGVDVLKHLLEEQNLNGADLSRLLGGSRNLGPMILRGERKLTLNHLRKLSERFEVSADLLLN